MSEDVFTQALLDAQNEWEDTASDWKPNPGQYVCQLVGLKTGMREVYDENRQPTGDMYYYFTPQWKILQGQPMGASFDGDMCNNKSQGARRVAKGFVEKAIGQRSANLSADLETLKGLVNHLVVTVSVVQNGKYTNCRIGEVHSRDETQAA